MQGHEELAIDSLFHQGRQAELPLGSGEWLLAVIGAVAAVPAPVPPERIPLRARRSALEEQLQRCGLSYGTGADDPAVELPAEATAGARAFAHFVAGLVRLCARAASLAHAPGFVPDPAAASGEAVRGRRAQLVAVLAAAAGEGQAAAKLFAAPLQSAALQARLADRAAAHLSRRYLASRGPFAGLPLHNALCAIEVRTCATIALAAFEHRRLTPPMAGIATRAALEWRALLVELLSALARVQEDGKQNIRGMEQVLRSQRLPAREARRLRLVLQHPHSVDELGSQLHTRALQRFALNHVLLAALVDRHFDAGEVAFVERLARAASIPPAEVTALEVEVNEFYRRHTDALAALRLADEPEGLSHALTTRLEAIVTDNLDRILQELRETGELTELLAKAAGGATLSPIEKAKVREQLLDLLKTIPALAIFAAPFGAILLPIVLKLLPFNLLPSSFVDAPPALPTPRDQRRAGSSSGR